MTATKYILGTIVGTGGMGVVHRATVEGRPDAFAIKQLRPELVADTRLVRRFENELHVGLRLAHPNIVRLVDYGDTPAGPPFLVMAWVDGEPLAARITRGGAMAESVAVSIITQLAAALAHAHDSGIAHGDVKSDNVLVDGDGEATTVTLIDWGLARFLAEPTPRATEFVSGTPGYMAPEVLQGEPPGIPADIYAAGVMFYELLTGSVPFGTGTSTQISARQMLGDVEPPSARVPGRMISPEVERAVMRCLAPSPADRHATARDLARAIARPAAEASVIAGIPHDLAAALMSSTPTHDWNPIDLPRGSRIQEVVRTTDHEEDAAIAEKYLLRASELLATRDLRGSALELELAASALRLSCDPSPALWPVLLSLAAIRGGLGDRAYARRIAFEARVHAARANAEVGTRRADALIGRLAS